MTEDEHIDVCLRCGRYYGYTKSLEDMWRNSPLYREGGIMPQLCFNCMEAEYASN